MEEVIEPELVVAFVAPTGSNVEEVARATRDRLSYYRYETELIRLSDYLLEERAELSDEKRAQFDTRIEALQDAGNAFRLEAGRGDALAFVAVNEIREIRLARWMALEESERPALEDAETLSDRPLRRMAYLVWSLKHPDEVDTLRNIYRSRFVLISLYAPRGQRERHLMTRIAQSRARLRNPDEYRDVARKLIERDQAEPRIEDGGEARYGQDVRDTYPKADFFVDDATPARLRSSMRRTIDILFGAPFETPTKDEFGMYFAQAAALRSAELGRQVGASICTEAGSIVSVGTNEVPSPGGGQYWPEDGDLDHRQYQQSADISDQLKQELAAEVLEAVEPFLGRRGGAEDASRDVPLAPGDGATRLDRVRPCCPRGAGSDRRCGTTRRGGRRHNDVRDHVSLPPLHPARRCLWRPTRCLHLSVCKEPRGHAPRRCHLR